MSTTVKDEGRKGRIARINELPMLPAPPMTRIERLDMAERRADAWVFISGRNIEVLLLVTWVFMNWVSWNMCFFLFSFSLLCVLSLGESLYRCLQISIMSL